MPDSRVSVDQRTIDTGVPGLDEVLGGGLLSSGLYLIEGRAGAGKTILASQMAFHRARRGERVLFVTLGIESHGKLLNHLRPLTFFDDAQIAASVFLFSAYAPLTEGLDTLLRVLADLVLDHRPSLLVIDGFRAAVTGAGGERALSAFLHQLDVVITGVGCATLLLSPTVGADASPEHTLVDGIIALTIQQAPQLRRVRLLEVRKLRGTDHLTGQHVFRITDDGLRVFSRLESTTAQTVSSLAAPSGELSTGIASLDALLGGGLPHASTTALLGEPGAGKTLIGLSFLEQGLRSGETVEYFGFFEPPERLIASAHGIGLELADAARSGRFVLQWQPPLELLLDELGTQVLESVHRSGATRLFVDGLDAFYDAGAFPERIHGFLVALTLRLRAAGVTTLFSQELPLFSAGVSAHASDMSPLFENILLLRYVETGSILRRLTSVMKKREGPYDTTIREVLIGPQGITVTQPFPVVPEALTGHSRSRSVLSSEHHSDR